MFHQPPILIRWVITALIVNIILRKNVGEDACPFNSLYWNFFDRHQDKLSKNPRLGIVNSQLKKMNPTQKEQINKKARILFKKFKYSLKNSTFII